MNSHHSLIYHLFIQLNILSETIFVEIAKCELNANAEVLIQEAIHTSKN